MNAATFTRAIFAATLAATTVGDGHAVVIAHESSNPSVESCRRLALEKYPGTIERITERGVGKKRRLKLLIEQKDGREMVVVCDGVSGKILRTISLDDE